MGADGHRPNRAANAAPWSKGFFFSANTAPEALVMRYNAMTRWIQFRRRTATAALLGLAAVSALTATVGASAQTTPAPTGPQDPRSTQSDTRPGETLSDRLDRTGGVIRPPSDIAPEMRQARPPDPDPGTTPVIPPPGSPGGNREVEPK